MILSERQKIMLDENEKKRANRILADPVKILLLLKIIKNPGITSRQLKEELKLKGTKVYYYVREFEGVHPKSKKLMYKPLVRVETEETANHLLMKKYFPNGYLLDVLATKAIFVISNDSRENIKWNYSLLINIEIALLKNHLRDIEKKSLYEFDENSKYFDFLSYNKIALVKKSFIEDNRSLIKEFFNSVNLENPNSVPQSLIQLLHDGSHAFMMNIIDW